MHRRDTTPTRASERFGEIGHGVESIFRTLGNGAPQHRLHTRPGYAAAVVERSRIIRDDLSIEILFARRKMEIVRAGEHSKKERRDGILLAGRRRLWWSDIRQERCRIFGLA